MADEQQPTPPPQQTTGPPAPESASSQAIIALVLGIVGFLFCTPLGIAAWIIGAKERKAIQQGESPEAGMGLATAGWIIGIVDTVILIIVVLVIILILVLGLGGAILGGASGG